MAYIMEITRVASGFKQNVGAVPYTFTTKALIHAQLAATPDKIAVVMDGVNPGATEAQIRGLLDYAQAIALGTVTSSVETAINAII